MAASREAKSMAAEADEGEVEEEVVKEASDRGGRRGGRDSRRGGGRGSRLSEATIDRMREKAVGNGR